ncbi:MAG: TolC family protein [Pseudomonadota bacterium]
MPVRLETELADLVVNHPRLAAATDRVREADEGVREAKSLYLPEVAVSGRGGYAHFDTPARRVVEVGSLSTGSYSSRAIVRQRLFDGNGRAERVEIASIGLDRTELERQATLEDVLLEGATAYHAVIRDAILVEIAFAQEGSIKRQLNLEDERVRRGGGIAVDVLFAKARLQNAVQERVALEGEFARSKANYAQVFGRLPDVDEMVEPIAPLQLLPETLDAALAIADAENLRLAIVREDLAAADRDRALARSSYFPRIDLLGEGILEENVDGISGYRREAGAYIEFSWTLFDGFAREARTGQAAARFAANQNRTRDVDRLVREEVERAYVDLETARQRVGLLENAATIAAEVFEARRRLRALGEETAINVLDAESELFEARLELVEADFTSRIAVYRLAAALGRLTPAGLELRLKAALDETAAR